MRPDEHSRESGMGTANGADELVERLKARIGEHLRVEELIWFGSRANGTSNEWSDYDFIVVSPDFEGISFIDRGGLLFPLRERGASYDFLCYTPEEYARLKSRVTMVREVSRTGVRIS